MIYYRVTNAKQPELYRERNKRLYSIGFIVYNSLLTKSEYNRLYNDCCIHSQKMLEKSVEKVEIPKSKTHRFFSARFED